MKKANNEITTYEYEIKICVDIVETPDSFEAWIYDKDYGTKELMWGKPKKNIRFNEPYTQTFEGFKKLVSMNIKNYIGDYYMSVNRNES